MKLTQKIALLALALAPLTSSAVTITIATGSGGNAGTDNVLFNVIGGSGPLVQGTFASGSDGAGFTANFTSASGSGNLGASGGQAVLVGGIGNDPFSDVTVALSGGATFTKAIFNIDSESDGSVDVTVTYIDASTGSPFSQSMTVDDNGSNFMNVVAAGAKIVSININANGNVTFSDINQWRLGGFARETNVPDGGATIALLGLGSLALGLMRRKA